jgi:MFS family permease
MRHHSILVSLCYWVCCPRLGLGEHGAKDATIRCTLILTPNRYDSAFIGTTLALPSFTEEFNFEDYSASKLALLKQNIVSVYQAGAFFGSLSAYVSSYYLGRRWSMAGFTLIFLVGAGIMLAANEARGLAPILGGRVLAGFGVGGLSNMTPIYISELAPPAIRGRLVGFYELGWQAGGLVGFWIN